MWSNQEAMRKMIDTLKEDIIPAIDDPFPRGQAVAIRSILKNLEKRLVDRTDYIEESNRDIEGLIETLDPDQLNDELTRERAELLEKHDSTPQERNRDLNWFLEDLVDYLWSGGDDGPRSPELLERVRDVLRSQLDRELEVTS